VDGQDAPIGFDITDWPLSPMRMSILPPLSGNPRYNLHADDIDFQIESDIFGMIAPGMPQVSNRFGDRMGHIMNYGDGVYGGMFISAMYTQAFFASNVREVVESGLKAIPAESLYAQSIRDVIRGHDENPNDWLKTWHLLSLLDGVAAIDGFAAYFQAIVAGQDQRFDSSAQKIMIVDYQNADWTAEQLLTSGQIERVELLEVVSLRALGHRDQINGVTRTIHDGSRGDANLGSDLVAAARIAGCFARRQGAGLP
jgi:hypothetical protein